jgi:uncharacterized membrane protein YcjF (UPF0283 family)
MLGTVKLLYRNPKDVNLEIISQEINRKKREAAMREAEVLAAKQLEEEKKVEEETEREHVKQEAQAQEVARALEEEKAEKLPPAPEGQAAAAPPAPHPSAALPKKPGFSLTEQLLLATGIVVGLVAVGGLVALFL